MHLKINLRITKKILAIALACLALIVGSVWLYIYHSNKSPLPGDVKDHVSFKVIYPTTHSAQIDKNSFVYQSNQKVLTFNVKFAGTTIAYSEQEAPQALGGETQAYYPALGIHPYAQFKTDVGQVALTKFWQSGNFKPTGQSAVLASGGTFVIAHTDKSLTNQQWKSLFESAKAK